MVNGIVQTLCKNTKRKNILGSKTCWVGMLVVVAEVSILLPGINPSLLTERAALADERVEDWMPYEQQVAAPTTPEQYKPAHESTLPDYYRRWLDENVVSSITPEEKNEFLAHETNEMWELFVDQFLVQVNLNQYFDEKAFKAEFCRRIAYANEHFASSMPGWKTDRGRIYIMLGDPDEIESHPNGGHPRPREEGGGTVLTFPYEKWRYWHIDTIGDDIEIEFVDVSMTGEYRMAVNPDEKETLLYIPSHYMPND
jgi:GWxTD domain-containing protein